MDADQKHTAEKDIIKVPQGKDIAEDDIIIVGGGHNGLVCAFYLARAGFRVRVLERRHIVGGACTTEEFSPGFHNSICAYSVSVLQSKIIDDMKLHDHGYSVQTRPLLNFLPLPDGDHLKLYSDHQRLQSEFSRFSQHDGEILDDYFAMLERLSGTGDMALRTPPNAGGGLLKILKTLWANRGMASLDVEAQRDLADLMVLSVADAVGRWFESDPVRAIMAFRGVMGMFSSPYTPGTANVLLHHCLGEVNGEKGVWGHVRGGMGAVTQAMARSAEAQGAVIEVNANVAEVLCEARRATGVRLEDGRVFRAQTVVSNVNPKLLFLQLIDRRHTPPEFYKRMENYRCVSGTFRMNVALSELPNFTCCPGTDLQEHHTGAIIMAPSLDYMDEAYQDARRRGWSRNPIVEMLIPSTIDDTLATEGKHVASLFAQHFSPNLPNGMSWDDVREQAAEDVINTVTTYAPNFRDSIVGSQILTPLDLEREFGLLGGDIFHGALDLNQVFALRPTLGHADYRMPIKGLYLCGSGSHPGGGVSGAPGHNAAHEIIRDLEGIGRRLKTAFSTLGSSKHN